MLNKLTDSMEKGPSWEANSRSSSQEIPRLLWKPKVHYRVYRACHLSQINPVHTFPHYFVKIHSNIFLLSTPRSAKFPLSLRFFDKNCVCNSHLSTHATFPPNFFDLITLKILGEAWKLRSSSLCSLLQPPATSTLFDLEHPVLKHPHSMFFL
jgi:hypothetical protein